MSHRDYKRGKPLVLPTTHMENKSNMSSDHVTKSIEDLTQAGELAITTVMGPATADLQALLTTDSTLLTELAAAAQKATADGLEQSDLADKLRSVQRALLGDKAQQFQEKLQQTKQQLTAVNGASGAAAERLLKAEAKFSHSLKFICNQVQKISKAEAKIKKLNSQLTDILDSTDDDTSDDDTSSSDTENDKKKLMAKKKKAKLEAEYREALQKKRDQYVTQKKLCEQQIFEHFDDTLGGMQATVKCTKNELDLPKQLEKMTMRAIIDAFKTYFLHRANEYWAVLPYVYYILSSYNPKLGLFYRATKQRLQTMLAYLKQSDLCSRHRLSYSTESSSPASSSQAWQLSPNNFYVAFTRTNLQAVQLTMALWHSTACWQSTPKWTTSILISLEQEFMSMHHTTFMSGSPAMKVKHLQPYLDRRFGAWESNSRRHQTIIPIVDILTQRENKFASRASQVCRWRQLTRRLCA